jgi:hypothetical protein
MENISRVIIVDDLLERIKKTLIFHKGKDMRPLFLAVEPVNPNIETENSRFLISYSAGSTSKILMESLH